MYAVDRNRWATLDIFNQMGNIYSEVGRSFKSMKNMQSEDYKSALIRSIDLFDATVSVLIEAKSPKVREVLRAKEVFLNLVTNPDADQQEIQKLEKYFLQFAIAARNNR